MPSFRPDDCEIEAVGEHDIRLSFNAEDGESRQVLLARTWLPVLLAQLTQEVRPGQAVPIDPDSLQNAKGFVVEGFRVQRRERDNGSRRLVLTVDTRQPRGIVTVPLELPPYQVAGVLDMLEQAQKDP